MASLLLIALLVGAVHVEAEFCAPSLRKSSVRLQAVMDHDAGFQPPYTAELEAVRYNLSALFAPSTQSAEGYNYLAGFQHGYSSLSLEGLDPAAQTNGHLHTLSMPWYWFRKEDHIERQFGLAAAISTSSNGLKKPDELGHQVLQLWLSWEDRRTINQDWDWLLGVCGDHRFGSFRVYPVAGVVRKFGTEGELRLAFPDARIGWTLNDRLRFDLRLEPMGNDWRVYDQGLQRQSSFQWRSWSVSAEVNWRMFDAFSVLIRTGQRFDQELEFSLVDGSRLESSLEDSFYWSVGLTWWL